MNDSPVRAALRDLRRLAVGPDYRATGQPPGWWVRWRVIATQLGVLALLGLSASATAYLNDNRELPPPLAGFIAFATTLPVAFAFRRPLLAWRLSFVALFLGVVDADPTEAWPWHPVQVLGFLLVLALLAARADAGVVAWTGALSLLPVFLFVPANAYGVAILFLAVLIVGDQIRRRRQSQRALAAQAEVSELEKARRAVLEERTRIAREMHDVVAHHMSMIAVQAETAPYRLDAVSEPARAEFGAIAGAARQALTDMRRLLGVLRSESAGPETAPQPGLADVAQLVDGARRAGMTVALDLPDAAAAAPDTVELTAYRIVQEALANAARHAPGATVRVLITADPGELRIRVDNGPPADQAAVRSAGPAREGHGLTGMRERIRLLDGWLTAEHTDGGGFRLAATLPYEPPDRIPTAASTETEDRTR